MFDAILKRVKAKYVLGLTATPIRRDGQQPIIFMQCGPIRYTDAKPAGAPHDLEVMPRSLHKRIDLPQEAGIQDVFHRLANDPDRTTAIAGEIENAYSQGRKVLVLTELQQYAGRLRREHATKTNVRIIDFVDSGHPALVRMWEKRKRGYRAMGYRLKE